MNIWAVGRNYREHAKEMGAAVPTKPMIFLKAGSTVLREENVRLWRGSEDIHHEIEIALRFENQPKPQSDLQFDAVALALDLTARDLQERLKADRHPWTLAKSFIGSCPMGPIMQIDFGPRVGRAVRAAAESDLSAPAKSEDSKAPESDRELEFEFEFSVNGQVRQHGHTKDMVFGFDALRRYCLECFPVEPGDWLLTGTPSGVSRLLPGDRAEAWLRSSQGHQSAMRWAFS
jgi:acylpyruvate hydrolase